MRNFWTQSSSAFSINSSTNPLLLLQDGVEKWVGGHQCLLLMLAGFRMCQSDGSQCIPIGLSPIEMLCWTLLFSCHHCLSTFLRGMRRCISAHLITVQPDTPHSSALCTAQHPQGKPCCSITEPHPPPPTLFPALGAKTIWAAAYQTCPHTSSPLNSAQCRLVLSQNLPARQPQPEASQYAAVMVYTSNGDGELESAHLRQGCCWGEVIKALTAGIAVHPTHLYQKLYRSYIFCKKNIIPFKSWHNSRED